MGNAGSTCWISARFASPFISVLAESTVDSTLRTNYGENASALKNRTSRLRVQVADHISFSIFFLSPRPLLNHVRSVGLTKITLFPCSTLHHYCTDSVRLILLFLRCYSFFFSKKRITSFSLVSLTKLSR